MKRMQTNQTAASTSFLTTSRHRRNLFLTFVPHIVRALSATAMFSTMGGSSVADAYSSEAIAEARKERLVYGKNDALFGAIESQQGSKPFGSFLDAGTGKRSLRWIATLAGDTAGNATEKEEQGELLSSISTMTDFTAVTADETMRRNCQKEIDELGMSHLGNIVIGNWFPPNGDDSKSLSSIDTDKEGNFKQYDTILADYLIGAMDGFSPYTQDQMIEKLAKRLKPGGRLYIVGLQPLPDKVGNDPNDPRNIICKVRQVRDACILLAGDRMYREYPMDWIERQVNNTRKSSTIATEASNENVALDYLGSKKFPIMYRHKTIVRQINVGRSKLKRFPNKALADEMTKVLDDLEEKSLKATEKIPGKRIQLGFDYVCVLF